MKCCPENKIPDVCRTENFSEARRGRPAEQAALSGDEERERTTQPIADASFVLVLRRPPRRFAAPRRALCVLCASVVLLNNMVPGEYFLKSDPIELNAGRATRRIEVSNRGDRPIQVGSHFHFFEVNRWLSFDRQASYGMRLDIPAGTAVRFEPGDTREVELVAIGGTRDVAGLNRLVEGRLDDERVKADALVAFKGFVR